MIPERLTVYAPAKINLFLQILRKREDGYHDLRTIMQKVDLCDHLLLERRSQGISVSCPDSKLPEDGSNLIYRAADCFFRHTGLRAGVHLVLNKRIPVAAGLGGGSSDAAAVLRGLDRLFAVGLSEAELLLMAEPLGADVPFFVLETNCALASGIGNRFQPAPPLRNCWILLVNPAIEVSTKWVYDNFALTRDVNAYMLCGCSKSSASPGVSELAVSLAAAGIDTPFNDLESVTIEQHKVIRTIKAELTASGANCALMSGSGPTVFGVFAQRQQAEKALHCLQDQYQSVFLTIPCW